MNREELRRRWNVRTLDGRWIATNPDTGDTIEATSEDDLLDLIESVELSKTVPPLQSIGVRVKQSDSESDGKGEQVLIIKHGV